MTDLIPVGQIAGSLLKPLPIALLLAVFALLSKGRAQKISHFMAVTSLIVLTVFSLPITANALLSSLEQQHPAIDITALPQADAVVLLTGGLEPPIPPRRTRQLGSRGDRLRLATEILKAGKAEQLIVAGGYMFQTNEYKSEAEYSADLIENWGANSHTTILETESRNTYETAINLAPILEKHNINSLLVVTSAYHMPRSMALLSQLADTVIPAPANILITDGRRDFLDNWMPNSVSLSGSALAIHEYIGMLRNRLR